MEDTEIVELYLSRDENAIAQTAITYGMQIRNIAYSILNDWESAKECENDTYWEAWNRIPPHEPRNYLFAFLGRITRSIAINRFRDSRRKKRFAATCELTHEMLECIPPENYAESTLEADELRDLIEGYLDTCTDEQQVVFIKRYWYCNSIRQISTQYGLSQSKIKSMLYRMREGLKQHLRKGGYHI